MPQERAGECSERARDHLFRDVGAGQQGVFDRETCCAAAEFTVKNALLTCSHISEEMISRTLRAFSRALLRHERIEFGYSASNDRNCSTLSRVGTPYFAR